MLEFSQKSRIPITPHGLSHISAVERNYDWLLTEPDLKTFNSSELFVLLVATLFHDAMMVPRKADDDQDARDSHIQRARGFLLREKDLIGLSMHEADAIADVIKGHGVNDLAEIRERVALEAELLDLRKLAACLSIADICHADSTRAPEIVLRHLEMNEDSQYHWRRHLQISGITRSGDAIVMSALTFSEEGERSVFEYKAAIEDQLRIVKPYFHTIFGRIARVELDSKRLESALDQTLQFSTNTPAILRLLIEGVYEREDCLHKRSRAKRS